MEKRHKDILVSQRASLVENLNIRDGLFTQLIAKKVLTQRMVRSIQNGKTLDEQIEALLDRLPSCGSKAFDLFCEALQEDYQEEIVTLYLKPEHLEEAENDNKSVSVQESSSSSTISEDCVGEKKVISKEEVPCSNNAAEPGTMSIREEFQQQIYCRSIEPGLSETIASVNGRSSQDQYDTRLQYENTLGNPSLVSNSVYSILTNPAVASIEKERLLSEMSPLKTSALSSLYRGENYVKDSVSSKEHLLSSPLFRSFHAEMSPMSSAQLDSRIKQQSIPFSFQTLSQSSSPKHSSNGHCPIQEIHPSPDKHFSITESDRNFAMSSALNQHHDQELARMSSPHRQFIGRDIREIPRHREVQGPADSYVPREMMSLSRHVEMVPSNKQFAASLNEEFGVRGAYINIQSLKRNDSVDTMNKRPFAEIEEPDAKRLREDIENIPSTPGKLTSIKFLDEQANKMVTIPVIDVAKRLPSQPTVVIETDRHVEMTQRGSLLGVMDDPEIDLTDGPINVMVEHSTRQFYLTNYKQAYKMRSIPRGKALIMNVNEVVGKSARRGTDIDRDNLHNLLCQLHFDVTVYNDQDGLTAKEMVLKLQDFSQLPAHKNSDCSVVCILSHGEEGYIFGSDGKKFELDAVFSLFDNTCCENLRGKPKLFIIQACRGGALDRGVQYSHDEHDGSDARIRQVPSMSDMLICYPTQNGYYAWRNRDRGSWYVEALVQVFQKYARSEDVCTMLNRVNLLVSKKVSHCPTIEMDQMSQMSEYKSTLRMPHFFFFPGIGGT